MVCSLLKLMKVFSLSSAFFHTSTNMYVEDKTPIAVRHTLYYPDYHIGHQSLVIYDKKYYDCLVPHHKNHSISLITPHLGFELSSTNLRPVPVYRRTQATRPPSLEDDSSDEESK